MFNNHGGEVGSSAKICQPDPEEQLKNIRIRKDVVKEAQILLTRLVELPIHFNNHTTEQAAEQVINAMIGEFYFRLIQLDKEEERVLVEIDK